ncbi:hypothetical protein [Arsenicitalea aurantiaca]|uniref:hypothetical protein n=1 Tax=Arsenicitalea aurantiaca TaxID=1783274 RepID=UPI001315862E|nr:hypothetical protein [Arsenicitalea aurantiaca]
MTQVVGATLDARLDLGFEARERLIGKLHTKAGAPGTGVVAAASLGAGLIRRVIAGTIR